MSVKLSLKLDQLPSLNRADLGKLWHELFGELPHPGVRREILVAILGYKLQEQALGGLKPSTARRLKDVSGESALAKRKTNRGTSQIRPGLRFVREWHGQLHEVTVIDEGLEYQGRTFRSLSEIARAITGTRWSGPAFFGLKKRQLGMVV